MRGMLYGAISLVALVCAHAARACAPEEFSWGAWSLDHKDYTGDDGLPFLSPGNDSRINLQFLMLDAQPDEAKKHAAASQARITESVRSVLFDRSDLNDTTARTFSDREGTRCVSAASGKQAFIAAAQTDPKLSEPERRALVGARNRMTPNCYGERSSAPEQSPLAAVIQPSKAANDFAAYLDGAAAFYAGDFDKAVSDFARLANAENDWLRETARYMVARALLNKAEVGAFRALGGAAEPAVSDKMSLAAAEDKLQAYLSAYPSGRYAGSARGLLRRLYWLAGDNAKLAAEYSWQIAHPANAQTNLGRTDLVLEIDAKYLTAGAIDDHDPALLATADLMRMRAGSRPANFPVADLAAQEKDFAGHADLFAYLRAARAYYVDGDNAAALQALGPENPGPLSPPYLAFSRETLRGQALMAAGQLDAAIAHWRALLPYATQPWQKEAVEIGLAISWERAGTVNKAFLPETRLTSPRLRTILLQKVAGPILLRMAVADPQSTARERNTAQSILLFKEATRGHYDGFLRDYNLGGLAKSAADDGSENSGPIPASSLMWPGQNEPYQCPALKAVIENLAAAPRSSHYLLCLGEFVRANGLDSIDESKPEPGVVGGGKSIFPGEPFSRGEIYKKLMADRSTPDLDKAYALYRAINCYAPAGYNTCGGKDVDKAQRKAWFNRLKTTYRDTRWGESLEYYW